MNLTARAGRSGVLLLRDPSVRRIVIERRDRFCRLGSEYVRAALVARGRERVVADSSEVDDDLARDMTEILTAVGTRSYDKRAAQNRTRRAIAGNDDSEAA